MVQFTHDSGKWMITRNVLEHNHDTNVPNHGHITLPSTTVLEENVGIDTTKQAMVVEDIGSGSSPKSFPFVNLGNYYLSNENTNILPPEDSQSLVNFLDHLQLDDPSFVYTVRHDAQSRIINFFWRDSRSKIDYEYFGDTLILDTTFRIEKYGIICALLVGVNHHKQYILFGCAFLLDDSTESFIWLFKTFLKAMAKCQPRVIFTDEHQSISNAVELELHETQHFLAMWYISQNARRHLSEAFKLPHFEDEFNKCISGCTSEKEFYLKWQKLLETYKLEENSWLNALYDMRKKWSHVFNSAGIRLLQECENITNVFHNLTSETITLSEFAWQYMRAAEKLRGEELYEDFCCNGRKQPMILENSELEKQAADTYTFTIFKLFQKELHRFQSLAIEEIANNGVLFKFKIMDEGHRCNFVVFNCLKLEVTCSCKKYELTGILCSHALKVLNVRNINRLPSHYIRTRWTKFAKDGRQNHVGENSLRLRPKCRIIAEKATEECCPPSKDCKWIPAYNRRARIESTRGKASGSKVLEQAGQPAPILLQRRRIARVRVDSMEQNQKESRESTSLSNPEVNSLLVRFCSVIAGCFGYVFCNPLAGKRKP